MHGFKSAILAIFPFCQNGTFEPVYEIQRFFWSNDCFWGIMNVPFTKSIHNMPQGPSNPGFMQLKVQKGDFLKTPSRELKFFSCLRFLWIPRRPGTLIWEQLVFLHLKSYTGSVYTIQWKNQFWTWNYCLVLCGSDCQFTILLYVCEIRDKSLICHILKRIAARDLMSRNFSLVLWTPM